MTVLDIYIRDVNGNTLFKTEAEVDYPVGWRTDIEAHWTSSDNIMITLEVWGGGETG